MNHQELIHLDHQYVLQTYGRFDVDLDHGQGATLYSLDGTEYIDFTSGIGVCSVGHANPRWVEAVAAQAASALDAVVHLRRQAGTSGARRYVASIGVLRRGASPAGAILICEEALHVTGDGRLRPGPAVSALRERIGPQVFARAGLDELPGTGERRPV